MESLPDCRVVARICSRLALSICVAIVLAVCATDQATASGVPIAETRVPVGAHLLGRVAPAETVNFALTLPLRNQAGLADMIQRLYDPSDPLYHHFLTADEFAQNYGASPLDYASLIAFAQAHGFTVTHTFKAHTMLDLQGPAATAESVFGVNLIQYTAQDGRPFHTPDAVPATPVELAALGSHVVGLNTAPVAHTHIAKPQIPFAGPRNSTGKQSSGYAPKDILNAYNLANTRLNGSGQNLVLFELDGFTESDIDTYRTSYGLGSLAPTRVLVDGFNGQPDDQGSDEVTLDIQMMLALAHGANAMYVYEAGNDNQSAIDEYLQIADDNKASVVSTSWGLPEDFADGQDETPAFQQMATEGMSIFAAAGDSGAYDDGFDLSVDDPAVQPLVTGVGGTTLTLNNTATSRVSEVVWGAPDGEGGGGGISTIYSLPGFQQPTVFQGSDPTQYSTIFRNVPDVSLNADPSTGYSFYYEGAWGPVGGTSAAAPLWAAFTALVNEDLADNNITVGAKPAVVGYANPMIYNVALSSKPSTYQRDFYDITSGNNLFYSAGPGYDDATGWGAFNGADLIGDLTAAVGGPSSYPAITSMSPSSWPIGQSAATVTITGTGFKAQAQAYFQSTALSTTVLSATQVSVTIPTNLLQNVGAYPITVQNRDGLVSPTSDFTVINPVTTIISLGPSFVVAGSGSFTLNVVGILFESGATVDWNGQPLQTTFFSNTLLSAAVPASDVTTDGNVSITVVNPGGTQTPPFTFPVNAPAPILTSITPTSVASGSGAFMLTATGSNFSANSTIVWNGSPLSSTFVSSSQITANVPASMISTGGSVAVSVQTPAPGGGQATPLTLNVTFAAPTITSLSPAFAQAGSPGFTLSVNGTGFRMGALVSWNGVNLPTTYLSAMQVSATVPATDIAAVTSALVTVGNTDNQSSAAVKFFVTAPPPTITSLSPTSAAMGSPNVALTVSGSFIQPGAVVMFGTTQLSTVSIDPNGVSIVATIPTSALATGGNIPVTVVNPDHGSSGPLSFTVDNSIPSNIALNPPFGALNGGTFNLVVTGKGILPVSVVKWNSSILTTTYSAVGPSLTAVVPASFVTTAGTAAVTVFNPPPGGGTSSPGVPFNVINPVPVLTQLSPSSVVANAPDTVVTLTGSGFGQGMSVVWDYNASAAQTLPAQYVSPTQATVTVPLTDLAAVGVFPVVVVNPPPIGSGGGTSGALNFNVTLPPPLISSITPALVVAGSASLPIVVTGQYFQAPGATTSGSVVMFGNVSLATTIVSGSELTATIPAAQLADAGLINVTIANPDGTSSGVRTFPITNPVPAAAAIAPTTMVVGSTTTLSVSGTNFVGTSVILINNIPSATTFISPTQLQAIVPAQFANSLGLLNVTVLNPQPGGATSSPSLTVAVQNAAAILTGVTPTTATIEGSNTTLTILGVGFIQGATVNFNGSALATTFINSTVLTAVLPSAALLNAPKSSTITVTNPNSAANSASLPFQVLNPLPTISGISPAQTAAGSSDFQLAITGTGFLASSTVTLNGVPLTISSQTATSLIVGVAAQVATAGLLPIVVTNPSPAGGPSISVNLEVTNPLPEPSGMSVSSAPAGSPALTLTITGSGFVAGSLARWNGSPVATTVTSSTKLSAIIPQIDLANAGSVSLSVSNPAPGGGTTALPTQFTVLSPGPAISSLSPSTVVAGSGSFSLTVNGSAFEPGAIVTWNGSALVTSFSTSQQLVAAVPGTLVSSSGSATVGVTNADGQISGVASITIVSSAPAPVVGNVTPSSAPAGSSDFSLTITGTGFTAATTVTWNATPLTVTSQSATRLIVSVPQALVAQPGTVTIAISTPPPGGGGAVTTFTITQPAPTALTLSPSSVAAGSGQFTLTITGGNFVPGSIVQINNVQIATSFVSSTHLTALVSPNLVVSQGASQVVVTNPAPAGGSSSPLQLEILPPIIHTFQPGMQLIGVPGDFSQVPLNQALDIPNPLLATWYTAAGAYELTPSYPADVFRPGHGYWVNFSQAANLYGLGQAVSGGSFFSIALQKGWNMVTCPYTAPVAIPGMSVVSGGVVSTFADASASGVIASPLYSYSPGAAGAVGAYVSHSTDVISPYSGYWLLASIDCTLRVPAPTVGLH